MSDQDSTTTPAAEPAQPNAADDARSPQPEAKPAEPQDDGRAKALAEERRRAKAAEAEALALKAKVKEYEDRELSAQQKAERDLAELKAQAETARQDAAAAQLDALRHRIAAEKNVPAALLTGLTEEALTASAEQALKWRGDAAPVPPKAPKPDPSVGPRGEQPISGADLYRSKHPARTPA
jgi:hypothetical protein